MAAPFSIIVAEDIDNTQRTLIHELVKAASDDWWHDLPDVWVVKGGGTADDWRDRLRPLVPLAPSSVMVLALKPTPGNRWATQGRLSTVSNWWKEASESE